MTLGPKKLKVRKYAEVIFCVLHCVGKKSVYGHFLARC